MLMKRVLLMFAVLLIASCEQSPIEEQSKLNQPEEFWATFEGADESVTRTYLDDQARMRWTADDRLTIFKKTTYNREFAFTGKTGANAGGFKQISVDDDFWFGYDVDYNYAIYPHSAANEFDETDCFFTTTMPAEQTYVENSFGLGANTMVAASESGQLIFKNVGSYLRVMLWGENQTVKKITLSSIAGEALAGEAKIFATLADAPTCTMVGTTSSIVLNCTDAVEVNTTEDAPVAFWIVLPPVVLSEGYKVIVENADGKTQEYAVNKEKTFKRNVYNTLKRELNVEVAAAELESKQILYTTTDENIISPSTQGFYENIVSNTYENGQGIILFDAPVTEIREQAFANCFTLATIKIPSSVTKIGSSVFSATFDNLSHFEGKFASEDGRCLIIDGVVKAFAPADLTSYTVPSGVTTIGAYAFNSSTEYLKQVVLPAGIVSIEERAFNNCKVLESISLPEGLKTIGMNAFFECRALTSLELPTTLESIGSHAFGYCVSLTNLVLPESVKEIGVGTFTDNLKMESITIPSQITTIPTSMFSGCVALKSVSLHENVTEIGATAFSNCKSLEEIVIPRAVTSIARHAFSECKALTKIYCKPTTPPTNADSILHGGSEDAQIYVPMESVDAYKTAEYWIDYADIIVGYDFNE